MGYPTDRDTRHPAQHQAAPHEADIVGIADPDFADFAKDVAGDVAVAAAGRAGQVGLDALEPGPGVGLMRSGTGGAEQEEWGNAIKVILPTFEDGGTHVNISGAAIAKNAPNLDNAIRLLEFLVSDEAQAIYAQSNFEYPVKPGATIDPIIEALGELDVDPTPIAEIATHRNAASKMVDEIGFND